jgi:hypothetical protein
MDSQGRQKPQGWLERQGARVSQKTRDEFEASPAGRRKQARLFLRENDRYEEETYQRENRKRPELAYKQEP